MTEVQRFIAFLEDNGVEIHDFWIEEWKRYHADEDKPNEAEINELLDKIATAIRPYVYPYVGSDFMTGTESEEGKNLSVKGAVEAIKSLLSEAFFNHNQTISMKQKITKDQIAQYCVNSNGDKELAEAIAKQFERAGFKRGNPLFSPCSLSERPLIGIVNLGFGLVIDNGYAKPQTKTFKNHTETMLEHLTSMVDEFLGVDEYAILREYLWWNWRGIRISEIEQEIEKFSAFRAKHLVTIEALKAAYAEKHGIDADKIELKEAKA